jgi:agmatine/peptidylarginine deiminase
MAGFTAALPGRLVAVTTPSSPSTPSKPENPTRQIVPEYAPVHAVLLPADLFGAQYGGPELVRAVLDARAEPWIALDDARGGPELRKELAAQGLTAAEIARTSAVHLPHGNLWLRDYGPLMVSNGSATDGTLRFADARYDGMASAEDKFPVAMASAFKTQRAELPVDLDGGNFLSAGDLCFTSASDDAGEKAARELEKVALSALGCRELVVVRDPPHVHIDMWMKVVGPKTAFVNEISELTMSVARDLYGHVPPELTQLRDNLNAKAREIARYLDVVRVPMPMPYRNVFRTYTNAALVNGTAIIPHYERYGWGYDDYPDARFTARYEQTVTRAYERHGFRTRFVPADGLIYNGGAFHCVMLQVPKLGAAPRATNLVKGF